MATGTNGISTEQEAKNKLQLGSNPSGFSANRAITKTRVLNVFGGSLYNANTYTNPQCVKYSDIYKPQPTQNDYLYCHELAIADVLTSGSSAPSSVPLRYDSDFANTWTQLSTNSYIAQYNSMRMDASPIFKQQQVLSSHYEGFYKGYGTPAKYVQHWSALPTQTCEDDWGQLYVISGCTPNSHFAPVSNNFNSIHTACINSTAFQYDDTDGHNHSAFLREFEDLSTHHYMYIAGAPYYNANNYLPTFFAQNNIFVNMKFGQQFFITIIGNKINGAKTQFSYTLYLQEYTDNGILPNSFTNPWCLSCTDNLTFNLSNPMFDSYIYFDNGLKITQNYNSIPSVIKDNEGILFTITYMLSADGNMLILKIVRTGHNIGDISPLITPYITDIALGLHNSKVYPQGNEDINLWYNYDDAPKAGWNNVYPEFSNLTQYMGLDACAMYQIRFITNYDIHMSVNTILAPVLPKEEYPSIPIVIEKNHFNPTPYFFDLCIPNPTMAFPIVECVSEIKLEPSGTLYNSGFAIAYLRAPVFLNSHIDLSFMSAQGVSMYYEFKNKSESNSTFIYETIMRRFLGAQEAELPNYDMIFKFIQSICYMFSLRIDKQNDVKQAFRILFSSVPYIMVRCESVVPKGTFIFNYFNNIWDFDALKYYLAQTFGFNVDAVINDYLFLRGEHVKQDQYYIGIPEFLFFWVANDELTLDLFRNRINVINKPRAIQIVIPLDDFGTAYNNWYMGKYGWCLNEMYVYYKTYFYHYQFQ